MTPSLPQFYSGTSTLAMVARLSAVSLGLVYGNTKLKFLKVHSFIFQSFLVFFFLLFMYSF
ncbi:hypothetical protein KSS87_001322, partial [Heliosperma pusillum]